MLLYLLRHADADTVAPSDDARFLSEKGLIQAKKVGRFCEAHELHLSLMLTSPIRRAHETAQIVAGQLRTELVIAPWLACGMSPQTAIEELRAYRAQGSVMLVGHEPDFGTLAAHLLGLPSSGNLRIKKGSLTLLACEALARGTARLEWTLPTRMM